MKTLKFCPLFASLVLVSLLLLPVTLMGQGAALAQADRVSATVNAGTRVTLSGHRPAWVASAADLGAIADTQTVQLTIGLTRSAAVQAAFDQLTEDQQNPNSARYHQWLTPAEIGAQFGPTQHDLDAVTQWLVSQGLTVDLVQPNRIFIQTSGSAGQVAAAFGTSLHTYMLSGQKMQAPAAEPQIPQALAPVMQYVVGLTDVPRHTHSTMTPPTPNTATNIGRGQTAGAGVRPDIALSGGTNWIAPNDFTVIYDLAPVYNSGVKGAGQKVMIIGGSRLNPPDLSYFESLANLPAYTPNYIVGTGFTDPGQTNDGNMGEGTLDFERVYGTAPGATIDQVIAANWLSGTVNFNLISYAINSVNDPVMSLSFGACEANEPSGYVQQESTLYQQAAAQGISVFASSGDSGVGGCENHGVAAQTPQFASISDICASPYVTCVGGTQFNDTASTSNYWSTTNSTGYQSALQYIPEGGWNEPTTTSSTGAVSYVVAASTGGASTTIAKPSWQVGTGVPADGARDVPDVSFSTSGHNAYFSCLAYLGASCVPDAQGSFSLLGFGGTSASAPSMAGIAALLDQKLGSKQGNLNPLLYKIFNSTSGATAFHDATIATSGVSGCTAATPSTCNNSDPAPTTLTGGLAGYLLQNGFDEVTGLGSLDVAKFVNAAVTTGLGQTTTAFTASPAAPTTNQTVTLSATVSSSATGTLTGTVLFTNLGTAAAPGSTALGTVTISGGKATLVLPATTFATAGTYNLTAYYSGDSSFSSSTASLALVVTAPVLPATTTTISGTASSITTQQTVSYTATVTSATSGTQTGTVQFTESTGGATSNLGMPVALTGGSATLPATAFPGGTYTIGAVYSGDTNFSGSTSSGLNLVVSQIVAPMTLSGVPAATASTTLITPSVTLTGGTTAITGTVTFSWVNGTQSLNLGSVAVTGSIGSTRVGTGGATGAPFYLPGSATGYTVIATFSDANGVFAPETATMAVTSTAVPTAIAFTPLPAATQANASITLTTTVSGLSTAVPATGTVRFLSGTTLLGTAAVATNGFASATVTLPAGVDSISAMFTGDANYLASATPAVSVTVPTFTLAVATPTFTLASATSGSGTDLITVSPVNGFTGGISFSCSAVLSGGTASVAPGCSVNPGSITYPATTQTTVTVTTVAPHAISGSGFASLAMPAGGVAIFAGLLGLCLPSKRRRYPWRALAAVLLLTGALTGLSGCGSSKGSAPVPSGGTTPGTYTVTVTGTATTGVPAVTTAFTVTVN